MPVATIGLFALALGLVVLAIVIQRALGGGGEELTAAERFQTQQALAGTATATSPAQTSTPSTATEEPTTTATPAGTPSPTTTPGPGGQRTYTVKAGDTCFGIAQEFGVTVDQLRAANGLDEACTIYPDQELVIPNP